MNLRKRIFFVFMLIFTLVAIAACANSNSIVTIKFDQDQYLGKVGNEVQTSVSIDAGSNYDENAIRNQLSYSSKDESVVKFVDGKFVAVGQGETTIKVEWSEKAIVFDTAVVVVFTNSAPGIEFTEYSQNMLKGASQVIGYRFDTVYTDAKVRWESANPEVATVDQNGKVTAVSLGEATIIAYSVVGESESSAVLKITVMESDYAINYVLNGGTNNAENLPGFSLLALPLELKDPSREGYDFEGWFLEADFKTKVEEIADGTDHDVTVYAKWAATEYDITYVLDGGVNNEANPAKYTIEDVVELADPVKDGSKFLGWFTDAELTVPFTKLEQHTGDVTVYAKFEIDSYKINYNLNGGRFKLPYIYQNHEEMVRDFVKDFNKHSGKTVTVTVTDGHVSTDFFARSWMADGSSAGYGFLTSEQYGAKWAWMLELLNDVRVLNGKSVLSASDGQAEARGEVNNFLATNDGAGGTSGFGCDYSLVTFDVYAPEYLPKVDGVLEAPTSFSPATGALVPDPEKEEYTFVAWATEPAKTVINTTAASGFWTTYKEDIFLLKGANLENPTFSFRVGLMLNADGTYRVDRVAQSGQSFTKAGLDAEIVISESYSGWAGTAAIRSAVQVGQTVIIDGDMKTGVAAVSFYDLDLREPDVEIETSANSDYWTVYKNNVFLFTKGSMTNALYSDRIGIAKSDTGEFSVASVAKNGQAGYTTDGLEYLIAMSGDYENYAAISPLFAEVKVGQIVTFDGDPATGSCTVQFTNRQTLVNGNGDIDLEAIFVKVKDENDLLYSLNGGTLSEGAPTVYLTSTGLKITATAEKAGYTFKGWSFTKDGEIITEIPQGKRGEVTLYAVFEAIEYTIEYVLNGGVFSVDSIEYIYEDFDELVADFLNDYATKYDLTGITAANFFTKSNSYGLVAFFKDDTLAAKWEWLVKFMLEFNPNYSGLTYMKNPSSASNYNKYWRANLSAFINQTKVTSPLSMDFTGVDTEDFWKVNVPTKVVTVAANPDYTYTADRLPLALAEPTKEGAEFVGWCDNEYLKREFKALPVGTLGNVKLYAKWSDSVEGKEMAAIEYELNGGELPDGAPTAYETGVGLAQLPQPTKAGYKFAGWTVVAEGTDYVTSISAEEFEPVKLYAHWTLETYSITYEMNGSSFDLVIPSVGLKLIPGEVSVAVTKIAGYYSYYKTDIMLMKNSNAPYLYADKIAFDLVDGYYEVVEVALNGNSLTKAYPYVIVMHYEYEHYNDANVQAFLAVEAGQKLVIEGDLEGANFTATFGEMPDPVATVTTTSLGGYWTKYNTDLIMEVNSKASYLYGERVGLEKVGDGYVVKEVVHSGTSATGTVYDVVFITNLEHPDYNDPQIQAMLKAEVGALVELEGDLSTGNVTFRLYALKDTVDTTTSTTVKHPTSYDVEHLPLDLVAPATLPDGKAFFGWYLDAEFLTNKLEQLPVGTVGNVTLYAHIEDEGWVEPVYHSLTFVLNGGTLENAPAKYEEGKELELPVPSKEGFKFLGWTKTEEGTDYVTKVETTANEDLIFYAQWKEIATGPRTLTVGEGQEYATLALALADAQNGDTIQLLAGDYEGATINKTVTIKGPNAGVNPNIEQRNDEARFTTDITVAASGVVFDGIALTGKARIITATSLDIMGLKVTNLVVTAHSVNAASADNNTAPIHLQTGANFYVYDFELTNSLFSNYAGNRPMILYIDGVDGLKVENNVFIGKPNNKDMYNDGIKTNNTRECILGDVSISHNSFSYFYQYVIWFRGFGAGHYQLIGNEFNEVGQTAGSHAAFSFILYKGAADEEIQIDILHNKVTKGVMLLRIDDNSTNPNPNLVAEHMATVKYNTLDQCTGTYYIKNESKVTVNCDTNYWGTATPAESKFLGVKSHINDCSDPADVPSEADAWFLDKIQVGAGKDYETLQAAIDAAEEGDEIYVYPGTYNDTVSVNKSVIIYGPQHGVMGAANRGDEAVIGGKMTITADNVVIDGLEFTSNIELKNVDNILITSIVMLAEPIKPGSDARGGQLVNSGTVNHLTVTYSYFNVGATAASGRDNIALTDHVVSNVTITDNYLCNEYATPNPAFYSEAIKIAKPDGDIIISNNEIRFCTDNFIVYLGSLASTVKKVVISDNILGGVGSTVNGTAGVSIRKIPADAQVDIIHNQFLHHNGTVLDFTGGLGGYVYVMYNYFDLNTAFKAGQLTTVKATFTDNFYEIDPVSGHAQSDDGKVKSLEELEQLYAQYLEDLTKIPDTVLSFVLDGGFALDELPEKHVYGEETALPALYKEGYEFVGWSTDEEGQNIVKSISPKVKDEEVILYAQFKYICITVGEGGTYATLTEALAKAKEFDVIRLLPGTYDETVEVKTNYIRIEGPNADIPHDGERVAEAIIGGLSLSGVHDIVINGVKFSNPMGVSLKSVKNISILNSLFGTTPTGEGISMIYGNGGNVTGLLVKGCSFITTNAKTHYRAIRLEGDCQGAYVTIQDNLFINDASGSVYIDCIKVADVAYSLDISHNTFDWAGNNWTVFIGGEYVDDGTIINFVDNTFAPVSGSTEIMSGATFRSLKDDTIVNILGNSFEHVGGTVLQTNGGKAAAYVTVKNNAFKDTSAKCAWNVTADNFVFENNYAYTEYNNTGTQKPTESVASADVALGAMEYHTITFAPLPGAMFRGMVEKVAVGAKVNVSKIIPTFTGYRFLGWYDNSELNGDPVVVVTGDADVTLYAKYELIPVRTITYVLNGGELTKPQTAILDDCVLVLPTPEKFGSSFLGWTLTEEGTDYVVKKTITEDTTFYAQWIDEEVFDVTVVLNGGSMRYADRAAVVADFIKDYNKVMGTSWSTAADIGSENFSPVSWHTFYAKDLDAKTTVRDKWLWLAKYLLKLSQRDLASNNCNVLGLKGLVNDNGNWASGDDKYGLLYAFRAFLQGNTSRPGSGYTSVDFSIYENANNFWAELSEAEPTAYQFTGSQDLPNAYLQNYKFDGWYLTSDFSGDAVTKVTENCTLYAKFIEEKPVTSVEITNEITELVKFGTHQLTWAITPSDAVISQVTFSSSDETVATVDTNGLISALKEGTVTITVTSASGTHPTDSITFEVYSPDHFEVSYETSSYTTVDGELQLNAEFVKRDNSAVALVWSSEDESKAVVDANGKVTAKGVGLVKITAAVATNGSFAFDFYVTVVSDEVSEAMESVLAGHNANIFTRYELGIGAGKPAYYRDIFGDVNDMMFNESLTIDKQYYNDGTTGSNHGGKKTAVKNGNASGVEWIVIHYTGNMSKGSTAKANANYFANLSADTSINYVIGNDGTFSCLDDDYVAFHAGDGTGVDFEWIEAGIDYVEGDPLYAAPGIVKDNGKYYYTLNGKKSNVEVPDPKLTVTDNAKNSPTSAYYVFESDYLNPKWFNDLGLPVKVVDGKYYIGTTWWCYTQVLEGRICSRGGNLHGVGIESAVNPESDLWYTWDKLAQLAAYLMVKYNLDITRVKMHHFFAAKDCHQPFLANKCEIWWDFLDQVELEYERITKFKDLTYTMTVADDSKDIVSNLGRVTVPTNAQSVKYTVTITSTTGTESITLSSAINGVYAK